MIHLFDQGGFFALLQVILIDIVLAGDNVVVIGMAAARVPEQLRRKVLFWGLAAAVVLRVILATITVSLLKIIGLMLAGGLLLLWVCWRLYNDIRAARAEKIASKAGGDAAKSASAQLTPEQSSRIVRHAVVQIAAADLSMSLDNVLAVAGAAVNHVDVLAVGLLLSIGMMGIAANFVAKILTRYPWVSYAGLFIVLYVAIRMIIRGGDIVIHALS